MKNILRTDNLVVKEILDPQVYVSKGHLIIIIDERFDVDKLTEFKGLKLNVSGVGRTLKQGVHQVRYAYVDSYQVVDSSYQNYRFWYEKNQAQSEEYYYPQNKTMKDDVSYPEAKAHTYNVILNLFMSPEYCLLHKIHDQIKEESSGGVSYYYAKYAKKCLALYEAGERNIETLIDVLDEIDTDSDYIETALSMTRLIQIQTTSKPH